MLVNGNGYTLDGRNVLKDARNKANEVSTSELNHDQSGPHEEEVQAVVIVIQPCISQIKVLCLDVQMKQTRHPIRDGGECKGLQEQERQVGEKKREEIRSAVVEVGGFVLVVHRSPGS
jgi:hypothetical protein